MPLVTSTALLHKQNFIIKYSGFTAILHKWSVKKITGPTHSDLHLIAPIILLSRQQEMRSRHGTPDPQRSRQLGRIAPDGIAKSQRQRGGSATAVEVNKGYQTCESGMTLEAVSAGKASKAVHPRPVREQTRRRYSRRRESRTAARRSLSP